MGNMWNIVYEDSALIVVYKEAGIATQSSKVGEKDMVSELKKYLKGGYVGVVHRLDQPVSGLLVFAKTAAAAGDLSKQVSDKTLGMNKIYKAVVYGHFQEKEGKLTDFLLKDKTNISHVVDESRSSDKDVKKAELLYEVIASDENTDTVKVTLMTGRHHQIRVQMANAGHPIIADAKYGNDESRKYSMDRRIRNICLTACELEFKHPVTKEMLHFTV